MLAISAPDFIEDKKKIKEFSNLINIVSFLKHKNTTKFFAI